MNLASNEFFTAAWSQLWQVTALIVVVALLVRLGCRRRPHMAHLLWMLVIVKCLTPPVWSSPTGMFSWAQYKNAVPNQREVDPAVGEELSGLAPSIVNLSGGADQGLARVASRVTAFPPMVVIVLVWLAGVLGLGAFVLARTVGYCRVLSTSGKANQEIETLARDVARRLDVRQKFRVSVTSGDIGPAVFGVFRPALLIPLAIVHGKRDREIEPILAHELVHIRRGDVFYAMIQILAQIVWWFHPLVWWVNREVCRQRERCCDEEAVSGIGCEPARYVRCLIDVLELDQQRRPLFALPGVHSAQVTLRRLEDIMKNAKQFHLRTPLSYWFFLLAAAVVSLPGASLIVQGTAGMALAQVPANATANVITDNNGEVDRSSGDQVAREDLDGVSNDEAEVVAALKKLEASIRLDDNGKVIHVGLAKNTRVTDATLRQLKALTKLESLQLLDTQISDDGLEHLKGLTSLKDLRLGGTQITDLGLVHLKGLTNLERLYLFGTQISDGGLIHLKTLRKLWDLNLRTTQITDAGLVHLEALPKLRSVLLNSTQITDAGLEHLKGLANLEYLSLANTEVTDAGLEQLKGLPNIQQLLLSGDQCTEVGVKHLKKLAKLQLIGDKTSDDSLAHLKELQKLESLTLSWTQVSDTGLLNLKGLPNLKSLSIWNARVSDAGLEHVKALTTLQQLFLFQTNVTNGGVKKFKEALPDCEISSEGTYQPLKK